MIITSVYYIIVTALFIRLLLFIMIRINIVYHGIYCNIQYIIYYY